jgi:tellurite resistance protein TehA-like permease
MGALAIATLAAAQIVLAGRALHAQLGWLPDAALATWAAASAWVLPLVLWEVRARATWRYGFTRWSFVFPLGMYSVASETLAHAVALAPLLDVALASFAAALAAWTLAALGLARAAVRGRR